MKAEKLFKKDHLSRWHQKNFMLYRYFIFSNFL